MWRKLSFALAFYLLYLYATTWPPGTHLAASLAIAWILGVPLACVAYLRARAPYPLTS